MWGQSARWPSCWGERHARYFWDSFSDGRPDDASPFLPKGAAGHPACRCRRRPADCLRRGGSAPHQRARPCISSGCADRCSARYCNPCGGARSLCRPHGNPRAGTRSLCRPHGNPCAGTHFLYRPHGNPCAGTHFLYCSYADACAGTRSTCCPYGNACAGGRQWTWHPTDPHARTHACATGVANRSTCRSTYGYGASTLSRRARRRQSVGDNPMAGESTKWLSGQRRQFAHRPLAS